MALKLITAISAEPITLTQVKQHLRLDSSETALNIDTLQSIVPGSKSPGTVTGAGIDVQGYQALVNLGCGTNQATGTVDAKIQESEDDLTFTDWTGGAFTQVTTSNDNAIQEKAYTGTKRYIRVVATVANANCEFAVNVIRKGYETEEDTALLSWIKVAREYGEMYTRRAFGTQTWELSLDDFPYESYIELPKPPLQVDKSIKYYNSANVEYTFDPDNYIVDTRNEPGKIVLGYNKSWPLFTPSPVNAVVIQFDCGYDGVNNIIPDSFISAMLFHVGLLYKFRDEAIPQEHMDTVNRIYYPNRIPQF